MAKGRVVSISFRVYLFWVAKKKNAKIQHSQNDLLGNAWKCSMGSPLQETSLIPNNARFHIWKQKPGLHHNSAIKLVPHRHFDTAETNMNFECQISPSLNHQISYTVRSSELAAHKSTSIGRVQNSAGVLKGVGTHTFTFQPFGSQSEGCLWMLHSTLKFRQQESKNSALLFHDEQSTLSTVLLECATIHKKHPCDK